jgi:hypothetical protein
MNGATLTKTCSVPTPAERQYGEIQSRIQQQMMVKIYAALRDAAEQARAEMNGIDMSPPSEDYFAAVIHQSIYCTLCKADPKTFAGGNAETAIAIIRNSQNIAKHYWGAAIEVHPRP